MVGLTEGSRQQRSTEDKMGGQYYSMLDIVERLTTSLPVVRLA